MELIAKTDDRHKEGAKREIVEVNLFGGQEVNVYYPSGEMEARKYVFGRMPETEDANDKIIGVADEDVRVKLFNKNGETIDNGVPRRAVLLSVGKKWVGITDLTGRGLRYSLSAGKGESMGKGGIDNTIANKRNFRVEVGGDMILKATAVGGKKEGMALQKLVLVRGEI